MATTPIAGLTPTAGGTSSSTLSEWAGPYVTDMLGKAQAISEQPYAVYGGPQTAGESGLQSKVFQGLGNLSFPGQLGQSFSSTGAYQPPGMAPGAYDTGAIGTGAGAPFGTGGNPPPMGGQPPTGGQPQGPTGIASQYMNPYLQSVLQPQMEEMRRQSQINLQPGMAKLTQAGGYGGGRQAIMESEANRNLLQEQNKTIGQGYSNAYDKAMGQFNTEQGQAKTLADMMSEAGGQQRGIEQQGISADYNEFLAQRDDPMKKTQYLQSMLQGLPISTVTNTAAQQSGLGNLVSTMGGMGSIFDSLNKFKLT
jgi:hypothetical protein